MQKKPENEFEGYYIEYIQKGAYTKVTAIDPVSGIEASIVGDSKASQSELNRVALQKLKYVLNKKNK